MELKQIAIFAWMPFLAADLGGIAGGYLSPYLAKRFKLPLVWSRVAGVALGAVLMLGPAMIGSSRRRTWPSRCSASAASRTR